MNVAFTGTLDPTVNGPYSADQLNITVNNNFPGPNATPDPEGGWTINVDTRAPTFSVPCTVTITDAAHVTYRLTIVNPLPCESTTVYVNESVPWKFGAGW